MVPRFLTTVLGTKTVTGALDWCYFRSHTERNGRGSGKVGYTHPSQNLSVKGTGNIGQAEGPEVRKNTY